MRVLVAGATGVIGRQLLPLLTSVGHEVVALARTPERVPAVRALGASAVVADLRDGDRLRWAVAGQRFDAAVHLATAIPAQLHPKRMDRDFAVTNALRTQGTRNLIAAVPDARLIAQSVAFGYAPGPGLADEDAPLIAHPPKGFTETMAAALELERRTNDAGGLILRFGQLYGPGTMFDRDGTMTQQVRKGALPLVGGGHAVWSMTHVHDAATAVVSALDKPAVGSLNIVDDDPVTVAELVRAMADVLGARAPRTVPTWLVRPMIGGWGVAFMNELRGADNARARLTLDWKPRYATWRDTLPAELA